MNGLISIICSKPEVIQDIQHDKILFESYLSKLF